MSLPGLSGVTKSPWPRSVSVMSSLLSPSVESKPTAFRLERELVPDERAPARGGGIIRSLGFAFDTAIGSATLVIALAVVSGIPGLNLLGLGYLLDGSARVAKSGRWRDAWIGIPGFAAAGKVLLGAWVCLFPATFLHRAWIDAETISLESDKAHIFRVLFVIFTLIALLHVAWSIRRGGRFRDFLQPAPLRLFRWLAGTESSESRVDSWRESFLRHAAPARIGLCRCFRLGLLGWAGALLWLALPVGVLLLSSATRHGLLSALAALSGSALLALAILPLPLLQTRFARSGRFAEFLDLPAAWRDFGRAPFAFWTALAATLLVPLPLYLLKIELTPRELAWLPNLVFVVTAFPSRLLLGWVLHRSERRRTPRHWIARLSACGAAIPLAMLYAFAVWTMQYLDWHGAQGWWDQHALLLPALWWR